MALLGGVTEVATRIGVSRQRFADLRERPDFPEPVADLASGPVWDMAEIERWFSSGLRRGPGRPAKSERVIGERFVLDGDPIGSGGFAEVFRATDRRTGEVVAVKILKNITSVDDEAVIRFRRELRLMQESLDHPHVNTVLAHGSFADTDDIWCAMPLAVASLADQIDTLSGDVAAVVDLAQQICAGVEHVHQQGILHRDLKPANILRTTEGLWAISDFGLAREDERQSEALTTTLASGMGTYIYASPEQWMQPKYADVRDDVFSIGKILQHALSGKLPLLPADQLPESALRPIIARATGPRDNRYASVADLLAALEQAVASYSATWETPENRLTRLRTRLKATVLDTQAADELLQWLLADDREEFNGAARALVGAPKKAISYLWKTDPTTFRTVFREFARWMEGGFEFDFCDSIANTARTIVTVTGDLDVLRAAVTGLAELGRSHNRWHVRDVLIDVLQGIRDHDHAVAALEGLQAAGWTNVEWSISTFAHRTLHPVLRDGIERMKAAGH